MSSDIPGMPVLTPGSGSWCPGQEITFTCVVKGMWETFAWESDAYIGSGGDQLSFSIDHPIGAKKSNDPTHRTFAVLLVNTSEQVESELHLYAQSNGTISCGVTDPPGQMTNITISIIDGRYDIIPLDY
jgi:hypothetical protein